MTKLLKLPLTWQQGTANQTHDTSCSRPKRVLSYLGVPQLPLSRFLNSLESLIRAT